ncbi:MAG TPA: GntR family transcriptional regulator [Chitinophagaceae bacterium]|nr:GntR family transcriptional regulator [Chitinophagaceae bacterium]
MKLQIDHKSHVPLHVQIEQVLRKLISRAEYKNGKLLPTEVELANSFRVSRNTIRQATNKLEHEGLITRKKGVGTFVTSHGLSTQLSSWHSFTMEMMGKGISFENLEVAASWIKADEKRAKFFRIRKSTNILLLRRLRSIEKQPVVYFESCFHPRIGLNEQEDFNQPLYQLLEEKFGVVVVRSNEYIWAQAAGAMAKKLNLHANDPLLVRERYVYDPGDRPVEYNIGFYRADKFTYSIDIKKEL